jgi:lysozyme
MIPQSIIKKEEGWSSAPYRDHLGYPTIGWGRLLSRDIESPLPTITTTKAKELDWLNRRIELIVSQLSKQFGLAWGKCSDVRKAVLISMCYQLGFGGISAFRNMWAAIEDGDIELAVKEMMDSLAARQTPARWQRQSEMFRKDVIDNYYK